MEFAGFPCTPGFILICMFQPVTLLAVRDLALSRKVYLIARVRYKHRAKFRKDFFFKKQLFYSNDDRRFRFSEEQSLTRGHCYVHYS